MRRPAAVALVTMIGLALSTGCSVWPDTRKDVSKRSPAMILLSNASNVVYADALDLKGRTELEQLSYEIDAPFPAAQVVCGIAGQLLAAGWRPLREDDTQRDKPSSFVTGWRVMLLRNGSVHVDQWIADWLNPAGDHVMYALTYRYPEAGPVDRARVRVAAIRTPADHALPADAARHQAAATVAPGEPARVTTDVKCGGS